MKVIKSDSSVHEYLQFLKLWQAEQTRLVLWQVSPETGQRSIVNSTLQSFHLETGLLHLQIDEDAQFSSEMFCFAYSEEDQLIFKSNLKELKGQRLSIVVPSEMKLLDEEDITVVHGKGKRIETLWKTRRLGIMKDDLGSDIMRVKSMSQRSNRDQDFLNQEFNSVSLDEEDKLFADKRESPRARPKIDKWVKVRGEMSDEVHPLKLFDLSRGGMSFITMDVHLFPKGSVIYIVGFAEFDLDDALVGKVMSQRPLDDTQIEFKVGVKFDEGQS